MRDNILFGKDYDAVKYAATIEACALTHDLEILEGGDMTEIGEKGVNLSGGQQQRISLARAVYNDADIYILDDVLSAVDAHVGEHIMRNCLQGMLKTKTRLLVTHQIAVTLPAADYIVVMGKDGGIVDQGTREGLSRTSGGRLKELLEQYGLKEETKEEEVAQEEEEKAQENIDDEAVANGDKEGGEEEEEEREVKEIIKEEESEEGSLKLATYWAYIVAMGGLPMFVIYLAQFVGVEVLRYLQNRSLGEWVDDITSDGNTVNTATTYIYVSTF